MAHDVGGQKLVTVRELARRWGLTEAGARAYSIRNGAKLLRVPDYSRKGQKVLCMAVEEADRVDEIRNKGFRSDASE